MMMERLASALGPSLPARGGPNRRRTTRRRAPSSTRRQRGDSAPCLKHVQESTLDAESLGELTIAEQFAEDLLIEGLLDLGFGILSMTPRPILLPSRPLGSTLGRAGPSP